MEEIKKLIDGSESINDEEKRYWHELLDHMTKPQIDRLREIFINEREKLAELEKENK
jgi:hypothetical protein